MKKRLLFVSLLILFVMLIVNLFIPEKIKIDRTNDITIYFWRSGVERELTYQESQQFLDILSDVNVRRLSIYVVPTVYSGDNYFSFKVFESNGYLPLYIEVIPNYDEQFHHEPYALTYSYGKSKKFIINPSDIFDFTRKMLESSE